MENDLMTSPLERIPRPRTLARGAVAALVVGAAAVLVASPAGAQNSTQAAPPFASGTLNSVSGSTLEVQAQTGTRRVVVTKSTDYRQEKAATPSDIVTGDCVRVFGTGSTSSGIQATTVSLQKPTAKGCTTDQQAQNRRGRFRNRAQGGEFPGRPNAPSGTDGNPAGAPPTGAPGGQGPGAARDGGIAVGSVTSVSGNQLTVKARMFVRPTTDDTSKRNTTPKSKTVNVTVSLADSTAITQTVDATSADLAVGSCVNATGTTDSVGTVTASTVTISQPQNGSCAPFGFRGSNGRVAPAI
jgi:hypothetical protein